MPVQNDKKIKRYWPQYPERHWTTNAPLDKNDFEESSWPHVTLICTLEERGRMTTSWRLPRRSVTQVPIVKRPCSSRSKRRVNCTLYVRDESKQHSTKNPFRRRQQKAKYSGNDYARRIQDSCCTIDALKQVMTRQKYWNSIMENTTQRNGSCQVTHMSWIKLQITEKLLHQRLTWL